MLRYFIVYKPFQVLTQFSPGQGKKTLTDFFSVSRDIYPVGRLDYDSEGLLLLTNDKSLNHRLLNPLSHHEKEYWVQVEGAITGTALDQLEAGVIITVNRNSYLTQNCKAEVFLNAPVVPERIPPIRFRKNIPTSWIRLTITEGKNRQVRKMTAAVGYPTLRLIRARLGNLSFEGLLPGAIKELSREEAYSKLFA